MAIATPNNYATREGWLVAATEALRPSFAAAGNELPSNIRFSIGFCSTGKRSSRIGECWQSAASADDHYEIFITPTIGDPIRILDVLVHELCHAALPAGTGHGPAFKHLATAVGLTGKMTATIATAALKARLEDLVETTLGPLPHAQLLGGNQVSGPKAQKSRWLKAKCSCCDYTVRITRTHAETLGALCPEHGEMIIEGL